MEPVWTGDGENATDNREWLADLLGVPVGSIGAPLWRWLESLGLDDEDDYDGVTGAAQKASVARNPVGYFQKILPGCLEAARDSAERTDREEREALARHDRETQAT